MKEQNDEIINLIDLGLLKPSLQTDRHNENRSFFNTEKILDDNLVKSLEQSTLFSEINLTNEMDDGELSSFDSKRLKNDHQDRNRKSIMKLNKLKNFSMNNSLLNTRNNYEKLTDSLLAKATESKYYGSFLKATIGETTFNNNVITTINDDQSTTSITSQKMLNIYLKEFEEEKHLNLLGFKIILIVILTFCLLISLIYTFKVYYTLTETNLVKYDKNDRDYWKAMWIINSIVTLIMLLVGIIGLFREKVILILITSVYMMFILLESDDSINGIKLFNISLSLILSTSVLLVIFAARLRCYAEDKLNLINKIQYTQF